MYRRNENLLCVPGDPHLGLVVNTPPALEGRQVHGLPPYHPIKGYVTDLYEDAPDSWPQSSACTGSYFVGIVENRGMWLDFNTCASHKHHVAVVVSIQGINPLTGRKTDKRELERYPDDPSVEKWLRGYQNYLSTTSAPHGMMWIDGFRAQDGTVRQYVFTKDESKGVAAQLIGADRVFAIGATFFTSVEPRKDKPGGSFIAVASSGYDFGEFEEKPVVFGSSLDSHAYSHSAESSLSTTKGVLGNSGPAGPEGSPGLLRSFTAASARKRSSSPKKIERIEISAGAEIDQTLYRDHTSPEFWNTKPAGTVVVNYAPVEQVAEILKGPQRKPSEGFLADLKVGN